MKSLTEQVGGDHYKNMKMQPFEFTMRNGWDACAHSILKYVSRFDTKGDDTKGLEDLRKALHICDIREDLLHTNYSVAAIFALHNGRVVVATDPRHAEGIGLLPISIETYIGANSFCPQQVAALENLERWVLRGNVRGYCHGTKVAIRALMKSRYGVTE